MSLLRSSLIVIDTETTGLLKDPDATPWEIAAVALDLDGQEIDRIEIMGRPDPYYDRMRRIIALGGIDPDQVLNSAPLTDHLPLLFGWLNRHLDNGAKLTAFNADFDYSMLSRCGVDSHGREWAPCVMRACHRIMDKDPASTLKRWENGELKWPSLAEAAAHFGVAVCEPQHRALGDARTAAELVRAVARRRGP